MHPAFLQEKQIAEVERDDDNSHRLLRTTDPTPVVSFAGVTITAIASKYQVICVYSSMIHNCLVLSSLSTLSRTGTHDAFDAHSSLRDTFVTRSTFLL